MRLTSRVCLLSLGILLSCGKSQNLGSQREAGAMDPDGSTIGLDAGAFNAAEAGGDSPAGTGGTVGVDAGTGLAGAPGTGGMGGLGGVSVMAGAGGTRSTGGTSGLGGNLDGGPGGSRDASAQQDAPGAGGGVDARTGGSATGGGAGSFIDARPDVANGGQSGGGTGGATGGAGGTNCGTPASPASNPCQSVACNQPPADACVDGTTLRHYDADGICVRGACTYAYRDVRCAGGCAGGICQGEACGAISCNTPAAASCANTSTFSVPAPLGVCSANACSYTAALVTCSKACSGSGCTFGDNLLENDALEHARDIPTAFALDSGNQPRFAWCEKGSVRYRFRGASGWQTIDVETDATLGTDCGVVMTLDAANRARFAYRNSTAKTLRFAEETAPGVFTIVTPVYNDAYGLVLASMPSGEPAIAYLTGPEFGRYLSFVARNGASWNIEIVLGPPTTNLVERVTQMAIAADGTVHIINGAPTTVIYGEYSDTFYARRIGTAWDLSFIKRSFPGRRALVLDAQGRPTILTRTHVSTESEPVCEILWTFGSDGTTLQGERVWCHAAGDSEILPSLLPDDYGEMHVVYWGYAYHRLAWEIWERIPEAAPTNNTEVRVGSDGAPRYLVPQQLGATEKLAVSRPSCHPECTKRDCGPDGCGGVCGVCAGCASCGENGRCNAVPSERVTRLPGQPIPEAMPTLYSVAPTPEGQIIIRHTQGAASARLGTTGRWEQTVSVPAGAGLGSGGGKLYAIKGTSGSVYRWDITRWDGTAWPAFATIEGPPSSAYRRVDAGGFIHFVYVDPGDATSKPQQIMHVSVSPEGVVGQPEVVVSTGTSKTYATITLMTVTSGLANVLHYTYELATRTSASANFVKESRHAVSGMGSWPQTSAPTGMEFASGVVDPQGTLWIRMDRNPDGFIKDPSSAYAIRNVNGQWTFPKTSDTAFITQKMPATDASLFRSPSGGIYSLTTLDARPVYYKLDAAADAWTLIAADIGNEDSVFTFDTQGVMHVFALESPSGVDHLRHWWFTPP